MAGVPPAPAVEKPSVGSDVKYLFQDMPVWGWLILAGGILMVVYFFFRRSSGGTATGSLPVNTAAGTDTGIGPALTSDQTQWQGDFQSLIDENAQILGLLQGQQSNLPSFPSDPAAGGGSSDAGGGGAGINLGDPTGYTFMPNPLGPSPYIPPSDQGNPGTVIADQPLNNGPSTGVGPSAGNIIASIPLTPTPGYEPVLPPDLPSWFVPFGATGVQAGVASAYGGLYPSAGQLMAGPTPIASTTPAPTQSFGTNQYAPKMA